MRITIPFLLVSSLFILLPLPVSADDEAALRSQRLKAQNERQKQVNERTRGNNDATASFRMFANDIKTDNRERLRELDTEFQLQEVDLKAAHQTRVAAADAEYQKNLSALFVQPADDSGNASVEKLQADARAYAEDVFKLKRQSAEELQAARIANEQKKNALLTESDQQVMDEAAALGLTDSFAPVLATPIGGGLTPQEERWNEREKRAVAQLDERNRKLLAEFRNGNALRQWEIDKLNEDFKLSWDEKAELQALQSEQSFYNSLFMQAAQGGEVDTQKMMADLARLNEQTRLVKIKYKQIRDKNRITRREEKKAILAQ